MNESSELGEITFIGLKKGLLTKNHCKRLDEEYSGFCVVQWKGAC
jgi:hypothetical protein